ncbi:Nrap protein [Panus rudis PR-1116 ss-1]|nr:Nrap protein [Panus rudis PR-1116 ss-1]
MDGESDEAEEDTWGGIGGNVENAQAQKSREDGAHSKTKVPPTAQELRSIRDATDLYRSSSFKLQIDALLPNVRPKQSRSTQLVHFLHSLHTFILSLNPIPAKHPLEASRELKKKGICVPYPLPTPSEDTNWKVTFEPPTDIILAGSWANEMSVKSKDNEPFRVDLALIMPASLFQEKDYLNARFLHKRAYYLAVINSALSAKDSGYNVECLYGTIRGDPRLTSLVVRPKPDGSQNDFTKLNAEVRIIPTLPSDSPIPINRLSPSRANIRTSSSSEDSSADLATPLYNTTILTATTPKSHLLRMNALKKLVPAFSDALALLRVWANQRGYGQGTRLCVRGFDGTGMMWGVLLDLLISGEEPVNTAVSRTANARKPLGKGLSSYQLFRAALDFLARHDFSRPTFVKSENGHRFPPEEYGVHDAVLVDATSTVNVFAGIPLGSLELLKYDATLTLEALNDAALSVDPFDEVFMRDHRDLQTRFDIVLRVDLTSAKLRNPSIRDTLEHGSQYNALLASMSSNLRKALGNRARAVVMLHPTGQSWPVSQMHPPNHPVVYVGLILDTEHAFRLVDHGPSAEEAETAVAKNFREFWGDKAELRRFKDGSISESVVWEVKTADERAHIPFFICRHILQLHHGIPAAELQHWQAPFDAVVRLPESITSLYRSAKLDLGFKAALGAFDQLVKSIKALDEEIPLAVLNVSPVSEHLRYTNVFAPTPLPTSLATALPRCAQYMPVMDIIIEFEKSGRWPDDLRAIQKIKLAFFERLATALMHQTPGLKANVVVGETKPVSEIQDAAQLEIVTPQGWAFSARIWHEREATLLDNTIDDKPHIPKHVKKNLPSSVDPKERHDAIVAKEIYTRRFIHAPRHHRAIAALCHRYTAYAGTVRLVKRWFASHWLLGSHVTPEVVELLCARAFLGGGMISGSKSPAHVPGTKERGFARVIELLKDWEWENGLFVPLYGDEETAAENKETAVVEIVSAGPKTGVWKVSTEFDRDGHMWTKDGPDAVVARRIRALAKATWGMAQKIEHDGYDVLTLFSHPTEHYDFIVHLDPSILPRYCQNVKADPSVWLHKGKYANLQQADVTSGKDIRAGFDPALLLFKDLSSIYRDTFKIFYDPLGGDRFGAVWDPSLKQPRPFRVLGGFSSIPQRKEEASKEKDKGLVTLNVDAVLAEIKRLGLGLITSIKQQV